MVEVGGWIMQIETLPWAPRAAIGTPRGLDIERLDDPVIWAMTSTNNNFTDRFPLHESECNLNGVFTLKTQPTAIPIAHYTTVTIIE